MTETKVRSKNIQEALKGKLKNYYFENSGEFSPPTSFAPWFKPSSSASSSVEKLNSEVLDLYNYLLPTQEEKQVREYYMTKIIQILKTNLTQVDEIACYGSYRNQIYLPTSDIDLVLNIQDHLSSHEFGLALLRRSAILLKEYGIISGSKEVFGASTPIMKCIINATGHQLDIGFDFKSAIVSCACIEKYLNYHPMVRPLVILTKHILYEHQLERVYTGGLSSYSAILLAVSFCQKYASRKQSLLPQDLSQLGSIWLEFLEFYGSQFDSKSLKICVMDDGNLIPRIQSEVFDPSIYGISKENGNVAYLWIIDPNNPDSNVSKGTFKYNEIEGLFYGIPLGIRNNLNAFKFNPNQSVLEGLVTIRPETIVYRKLLKRLCSFISPKIDEPITNSQESKSSNPNAEEVEVKQEEEKETIDSENTTKRFKACVANKT